MIVRELVDTFPNESIQDFQLCLKNGVSGKYGKIYNVDLSVLATWMGEYLEEKYSYIERQQEIERSKLESSPIIDELILKTTEYLSTQPDAPKIDKTEILRDKILGSLSEAEIIEEGQEKPVRKYIPPNEGYIKTHELRRKWMIECFDLYTGQPNENHMSFNEWLSKGRV